MISRRGFVTGVGIAAGALVVGFNPGARKWVTAAEAATTPFADLPPLDGEVVYDAQSRETNSRDLGRIIFRTPNAILRPGSVADIQKMIKYCRTHTIKVAPIGAHHAMYGQALVDGGLIIEMRSLRTIHSISARGADVDAGVYWQDVILKAYGKGLTPPSITGYIKTTVGGTLSMGGIGVMTTYRAGAQIDHVQQLQVVTGTGELVTCSKTQNSDLFHAVLGGLGQCGVIVRATVDLVPAKPLVVTYRITYLDIPTFFRDIRILADRGEFDSLGSVPLQNTTQPFQLWATKFYDLGSLPNQLHLLRGLSPTALTAIPTTQTYLDYTFLVTLLYDGFKVALDWEALVKPWLDLVLPDNAVESYVRSVVSRLTLGDVGPTGFVLVFPMLRSSYTQPLLRLPNASSGRWVWLFGIDNASATRNPGPEFTSRMLDRNYRLYKEAYALGGTRYPHGAAPFTKQDWQDHYGSVWPQFRAWKKKFDPSGILTPGPEIF